MSSILVSSQEITKSFGSRPLFEEISLGIADDERIGLIGPNGAGKSTLLKVLADIETPDQGSVSFRRNLHIGFLAQTDKLNDADQIETVLFNALSAALPESDRRLKVGEMVRRIGFPDANQPVGTLSGGWRKRLAIAAELIREPDLLFLDEPTNHLDVGGIMWLEAALRDAKFAYMLVSHDRYFLETSTNRIIELHKRYPDGFLKVEGNYSEFLRRREEFINEQEKREQSLSSKVKRELEWLSRGPKARTTKARARVEGARQLQGELGDVRSRNRTNRRPQIDFDATYRKSKKLVEAKNISIERGGKTLVEGLDLILTPGMCLGLLGSNGSGKSTLMQVLNRQRHPASGNLQFADGLSIVHFDQNREQLDPTLSLKDALSPTGDSVIYRGRQIHAAAWAERFLFTRDQLVQPVSHLSGGEQARVLIANLMLRPADILLLDEPTNDLDIATLEVLEESLRDFPGAVALITHDRYLLDRLSDMLLFLDGDGGTGFYADYDQWYQQIGFSLLAEKQTEKQPTREKPKTKAGGLTYEERKEFNKMEGRIEKAELAIQEIEGQLNDPVNMSNAERLQALLGQLAEAKTKVDELYQRWEELEARL